MRRWLLPSLELLALSSLVAGVALIYVPAAFITAGVLGVLACEWAGSKAKS